jgi:hypothetical protein
MDGELFHSSDCLRSNAENYRILGTRTGTRRRIVAQYGGLHQMRPRLQPGPTARFMEILRLRQCSCSAKTPGQQWRVVEKIREHRSFTAAGRQMPRTSEQQQAEPTQQQSFDLPNVSRHGPEGRGACCTTRSLLLSVQRARFPRESSQSIRALIEPMPQTGAARSSSASARSCPESGRNALELVEVVRCRQVDWRTEKNLMEPSVSCHHATSATGGD